MKYPVFICNLPTRTQSPYKVNMPSKECLNMASFASVLENTKSILVYTSPIFAIPGAYYQNAIRDMMDGPALRIPYKKVVPWTYNAKGINTTVFTSTRDVVVRSFLIDSMINSNDIPNIKIGNNILELPYSGMNYVCVKIMVAPSRFRRFDENRSYIGDIDI